MAGEQWRKQPYNMEKYCQESSGWQAIMCAGDALWNDRMMMMIMQTFSNLYTGQSTAIITMKSVVFILVLNYSVLLS
jgi:glutamate dehydrogenase/leucine dehydrogenase